ncbi:MAG: hypothetical protein KC543_10930 [Myxococcales bacterium]|nr:hypothetical protein [Myxococcales bacterium]
MSVPSDMMVTVTATDADTAAAMLSYSGNVSSCASLTGAVTTVRCPQRAQYTGRATVRDPDGNEDSVTFSFGPCQTGSTDF